MKITEEAPGVFSFKHGTAEEDAEIIRKARALLAERCPDALPDFERGVKLMYATCGVTPSDSEVTRTLKTK